MLWLCALTTPMCFIAAYQFRDIDTVRNWLLIGGFVPIAVACLSFIGFALFKPEKLQSDDYQLRHESLQLIQQKSGRLSVTPASIDAIANPERPALGSGGEE